ncbi:MAG: mechanosensitive ion channel family protein, partial [Candidatus Altiarchaeales archaeon HGW-Altiarchaeales-2]
MFGIENYLDVVIALIIITVSAIVAKLVSFILEKIVTKWVKKTKTTLDDEILKVIKLPVFLTILFIGTYIALMQLNILLAYHQEIQKIFTVVFILIATISVTRVINGVIRWYTVEFALKTETKFDEQFLPVMRKIVIGFVYAIAIMLILRQVFGIEITPLLASMGIVGLAVALALQDTLSNFFAGVYLIADRPIRIGDYVELENGMKGYVEDIGWRSVRIKMLSNNYIIIPNSKLAQSIITNYYAPEQEMSIVVPCSVSYDSDLEKVEKVTIEAAKEIQQNVAGAVKNFEPFIRYNKFDDSNINFSIIL